MSSKQSLADFIIEQIENAGTVQYQQGRCSENMGYFAMAKWSPLSAMTNFLLNQLLLLGRISKI